MRLAGVVAAVLLLAQASAQAAGADEIEKRLKADPRGAVVIANVAGDVQVTGWDRNEVQVVADLADERQRLDFKSSGGRTTIEVVLPKGGNYHGSTDLIVHVPRNSSLETNTVSADQRIKDVRGMQRLVAVSGMIETELFNDEVQVRNVSGEITVRGHNGKGSLRARTTSGDMRLQDIGPEMELETVTGSIDVRVKELSRARVKTINGDLDLRAASLTRDVRIEAEGVNGDMRFRFRGALDAEFDISTFNGEIDNCFGPEPRRTREHGPGTALRFKQGNGDGRIRIKTLNGGVEVCNR